MSYYTSWSTRLKGGVCQFNAANPLPGGDAAAEILGVDGGDLAKDFTETGYGSSFRFHLDGGDLATGTVRQPWAPFTGDGSALA